MYADAQMAPTNVGKLKAMHEITSLMDDAKEIVDKATDLEKKYVGSLWLNVTSDHDLEQMKSSLHFCFSNGI